MERSVESETFFEGTVTPTRAQRGNVSRLDVPTPLIGGKGNIQRNQVKGDTRYRRKRARELPSAGFDPFVNFQRREMKKPMERN